MLEMVKRALEPRNNRSWGTVWVFLIVAAAFFVFRAEVEKRHADRQETSFGVIGHCEKRGRSQDDYCSYSFPVGEEQFWGMSKAVQAFSFDRKILVYFDSQDPRVNALEDFPTRSRRNMRIACLLFLVFVVTFAFVVWDRTPYKRTE
jgi:hypothetical protein